MVSSIPPGQRFAIVPEWLISQVSARALQVWCILWNYADRATDETWVGLPTVAEMINCSIDTARRATHELAAVGAIEIAGRYDDEDGARRSNLYRLLPTSPRTTASTPPSVAASSAPSNDASESISTLNKNQSDQEERPLRRRDLLWECFVAIHGEPATESERGKFNRAVGLLRQADVTPEEYPSLVAAYTAKYQKLQPAAMTVPERIGEMRHYLARGPIKSPTKIDQTRSNVAQALGDTNDED